MAEQDFDVKIRTTADTSGIKTVEQQLAAAGAKWDAASKQFVSTAKEISKEVDKAVEGGAGGVGRLDRIGSKLVGNIGRVIGQVSGITLGFAAIRQVEEYTEQLSKSTAELEKQGAQLVKNAQLFRELAKDARTEADVIHIGTLALKEAETAHGRLEASLNMQLGIWEKIIDAIMVGPTLGTRVFADALKAQQERFQQLTEQEDKAAKDRILKAQDYRKQFEALKELPFAEAVKKLNDQLNNTRRLQANLNQGGAEYVKSWLSLQAIIERIQADLAKLAEYQKQKPEAAAGPRAPQSVGEWREQQQKAMEDWRKSQEPVQDARLKSAREAGAGESQALINQIEMNRINFQRQQEGQRPLAPGEFERAKTPPIEQALKGGSANEIVDAINRMADLWK